MKKKSTLFTKVNNIVCVVLLIVMIATMFIPCWNFTAEEKISLKTCRECNYSMEAEELEEGFTCPECGTDKRFKSSTKKTEYPDEASVMEFTWLAFKNTGLTKQFEAQGIVINDIVLIPFLTTLFAICTVIFCILNMKGCWQSVFPLFCGVATLVMYLTTPVYQIGTWVLTVAVAAALSVASLVLFAQFVMLIVKWFTVPVKKNA